MQFRLIRKNLLGAVLLLYYLGFSHPCFANTHSKWLEWKEKGRREQASMSYHMAEDYYLRSIVEANKIGPSSIELIESKERLAACLVHQKKFYQAEPYYVELRTTIEKLRKNKSLDAEILVWLEELAEAYEAAAMEVPGRRRFGLEHALALRDLISGDEHPMISITLKQLGKLYLNVGNNLEAKKLVARLVRVDQKFLGPDNLAVADDLCGLGVIEGELGEWDKSESYLRQALAIIRKNDPAHRTFLLYNARVMMARTMLKKNEVALSQKEAKEALADFEKGDGKEKKNAFHAAFAYHIIAAGKLNEKRYEEALQLYSKSTAILEPAFGKYNRRMILHWRRVQRVYTAMKATDKVNEIDAKIKKIESVSRTATSQQQRSEQSVNESDI